MVYDRDRGYADAIDEFEYVHRDQEVITDNQNVSQGDSSPVYERLVQVPRPECNVDERIYADNEDDELDGAGKMIVDEASTVDLVLFGEYFAIHLSKKPFLHDVLFDEEENDEDDGDDEAGVG